MSKKIMNHTDLEVYQKAFDTAMQIFELSKSFPKEETYSLTDQIRRSSRSVCANFAEAFRRRRYPVHFISKLTDSDSENAETEAWLNFSFACKYITEQEHISLLAKAEEVGRLSGDIIKSPGKYS